MKAIPRRMRARSMALARRFLSLKIRAAHANETMTELRRTNETTDIMESGLFNDEKYAKSAIHMNREISGMLHLHVNGVLSLRRGYHRSPQITAIMTIW